MGSYVVVTPSRGLVHSRTVEAVMSNIANASGHEFRGWTLTHDLPIPDCHETATAQALATGADALWFVEEDNIPPPDTLARSFAALATDPIAALDYPVGESPSWACIARDATGHIYWCGLGATLIHRRVFEAIERPWFRAMTYAIQPGPDGRKQLVDPGIPSEYGGQDIYFFRRALAAGFMIGQVPGVAGHARLRALGKAQTNQGAHTIEVLHEIQREQFV